VRLLPQRGQTLDGAFLMGVKVPKTPVRTVDIRTQHTRAYQLSEGPTRRVGAGQRDKELLPEEMLRVNYSRELLSEFIPTHRETGLDVSTVGVLDPVSDDEWLHRLAS
jgi:hypothetical protein